MKVDQKGHSVTIKDTQGDFNAFLERVEEMNSEFMFTPYFTEYDFNKIWRVIKKLDVLCVCVTV